MTRTTTSNPMPGPAGLGRSNGGPDDRPRRVAILHRHGDLFQTLVVQYAGAAASSPSGVRVEGLHAIPVRDAAQLATVLETAGVDRIVRVLPGGSMICRVLDLPGVEDEVAALGAVELQAEAALPLDLPPHRRAAALLPWTTGMGERVGLAVGWPETAPPARDDEPAWLRAPEADERFSRDLRLAGEAAALVELLALAGGEGMAGFADRDHRSLELVASTGGATAVRTVRLGEENGAEWPAQVARAVVETGIAAGLDDAALEALEAEAMQAARHGRQALILDAEARQRVANALPGAPAHDAAWWSKYGVAAGAAVGILGPRQNLFALHAQPPQAPRSRVIAALNWLAEPRRATRVALAAALVLLAAPLLGAWARVAVLEAKTRDLEAVRTVAEQREADAAFFRALKRERWPMTKLLADVAGMAPYELEFDVVNIVAGSSVTIRGTASLEAPIKVLEFQNNLASSGLFSDVTLPTFEVTTTQVEFEVEAEIRDPNRLALRQHVEPRGVRMYGEEARGMAPGKYVMTLQGFGRMGEGGNGLGFGGGPGRSGRNSERNEATESPANGEGTPPRVITPQPGSRVVNAPGPRGAGAATANVPSPRGTGSTGASSPQSPPPNRGGLPPGQAPEPLTDEQIAAMTLDEIKAEINLRLPFQGDRGLDSAVRQRLDEEWRKLWQRRNELSRQQSGGGG